MPSNYVRPLHSRLFLTTTRTCWWLVHRVQVKPIWVHQLFATFCITVQNLHATIPVQKLLKKWWTTWSDASRSEKEVIDHFSSFDLLVIDEYGLHDRHEKRLEMVHKVLYSRYDNMKSTLLISNFTVQNMQRDLGVRLWSRLHENHLIVVPCYWDDRRISG